MINKQHIKTNVANPISEGDVMPNIELTSLIQNLNSSVTFWNTLRYIFVGLTALFTVLSFFAFWMGGNKATLLNNAKDELIRINDLESSKQIKLLNTEAIKAKSEIAKANARGEEAKLELAKYRAQRGLTKEQRAKFIADLKEFSGIVFDISGSSNETLIFALNITDALTETGWYISSWTGGGIVRNLPGRTFSAGDVVTTGVHIQIFDSGLSKAKDALVNALRHAGFDGVIGTVENVQNVLPEHPSRHVMHINFGPKP